MSAPRYPEIGTGELPATDLVPLEGPEHDVWPEIVEANDPEADPWTDGFDAGWRAYEMIEDAHHRFLAREALRERTARRAERIERLEKILQIALALACAVVAVCVTIALTTTP